MTRIVVTDRLSDWPLQLDGVEILSARAYLTDHRYSTRRRGTVFNLCRSYAYQSVGYYVSLLAEARGHRPLPSVSTIQDFRLSPLVRGVSEELEDLIERKLEPLTGARFELSIYFGRNVAKRYDRLCQTLFNHFPAPMMRAEFVREPQWRLDRLRPIATGDIPPEHLPFVKEQALRHFAQGGPPKKKTRAPRYEMAILFKDDLDAPSDERAIKRMIKAAHKLGIEASVISKDDYGRIAEFDALWIRETTAVNHHTYRFARRAEAEGLIVIDDPRSIVRCTNKVYLSELFDRHRIASPNTMVVHRDNAKDVAAKLGFPCVLKQPDSSFSVGVIKVRNESELQESLQRFFSRSELVIAQEFTPSDFDYRVGVLDGRAIFVCKYYMVPGHWQIQKTGKGKHRRYGNVETLSVDQAPAEAVELAVRSASLIGNGLYGVDLKHTPKGFVVMEINDNPSIDAGIEDEGQEEDLYRKLSEYFYERLEKRGR